MSDPERLLPSPWHVPLHELSATIGYLQWVERMRERGYESSQQAAEASLANGAVGT